MMVGAATATHHRPDDQKMRVPGAVKKGISTSEQPHTTSTTGGLLVDQAEDVGHETGRTPPETAPFGQAGLVQRRASICMLTPSS
jgi:hypothetical protein